MTMEGSTFSFRENQSDKLVDRERFARARCAQDRFEELSKQIVEAFADVPEEEGMAAIEAAVMRERGRQELQASHAG